KVDGRVSEPVVIEEGEREEREKDQRLREPGRQHAAGYPDTRVERRIEAIRSSTLNGLDRQASQPASSASARRSVAGSAVKAMTGTEHPWRRSARVACSPSMLGMRRSMRTTSKGAASARSTASRPSFADSTVAPAPSSDARSVKC